MTTPTAGYAGFIVPCLAVGVGFVIATTVRTAIIFAGVPGGLPATAAALNESSLAAGNRVGIIMVTALVAQVALTAIGTPGFSDLAATIGTTDLQPYVDAYVAGVRAAFGFGAVIAIVAGVIAWIGLGQGDPLTTVWEHRDERATTQA